MTILPIQEIECWPRSLFPAIHQGKGLYCSECLSIWVYGDRLSWRDGALLVVVGDLALPIDRVLHNQLLS